MRYDFEWDLEKANANIRKHAISFERAASMFHDPNALSIPDEDHSETEERWITIGVDASGILLVVVHTFTYAQAQAARIRMISARRATTFEKESYEEGI